jgi:hypothetical protein
VLIVDKDMPGFIRTGRTSSSAAPTPAR